LFILVYRKFNFADLIKALHEVKAGWIIVSISFGLLSHFVRAVRWKMLINELGYRPRNSNLFLSILILYFTNLIIPRGGEVARCGVLTRYEGIPVVKLAGTVLAERIIDLLTFLLILLILVLVKFSFFKEVYNSLGLNLDYSDYPGKFLWIAIILAVFALGFFLLAKFRVLRRISARIGKLWNEFASGTMTIMRLRGKGLFLVYTLLIFLLWFMMLYVLFFAFPATAKLTFTIAVLTYSFGNVAYLLPIQAGIGAWHFIVINCLFFFGIDKESGMIFALVAHSCTSLVFLIFGPIAMALLPLINSSGSKSLQTNPLA
jgi:glycosyltransferase 2 family protein